MASYERGLKVMLNTLGVGYSVTKALVSSTSRFPLDQLELP